MSSNLAYCLPVVRYPGEAECTWSGEGKCLNVGCRYSLLNARRRIEDWDPQDIAELANALPDTCALSLAEQGPQSTESVAVLLGIPRDAVERTETVALRKLAMNPALRRLRWDGR
jgi:hypothetical protein